MIQLFSRFFSIGLSALLITSLIGCSQQEPVEFFGSDISDTNFGAELSMPDTNGDLYTSADFKDHVTVVFFGFTQCPDVCPTALAEMAQTMALLEDDAKDVNVVFISVDPERDTPDVLSAYVTAFYPDFIGLTGSEAELAQAADSFKIHYEKVPNEAGDDYTMDHSASFYVFDKQAKPRILIPGDAPAEEIASDLEALL